MYPACSCTQISPTFFGGLKGSIRVKAIMKGWFFLMVWDWWDCVMGVYIWDWVSEGIPCFTFVDFYILWGRRGNLCDCVCYFKVIAYSFYCVYLLYGTNASNHYGDVREGFL